MKSLFFYFFYFIFTISAFTQVGGEHVYTFLNVPTSARQVALGGNIISLTDDIDQPSWNPSLIDSGIDSKISFNYSNYLAGINIGSVSYAKMFSRHSGTFHAHVIYLNYGKFIGSDVDGNITHHFNANDIAISVGYARDLYWNHLSLGANIRFIQSKISDYVSFGITTDIALLYKNEDQPFVFTLVARNIGVQLTSFNGYNESVPFVLSLGSSYQLEHVPLKWYLTIDNLERWNIAVSNPSNETIDLEGNVTKEPISFLKNMFRHFVIGAELFPQSTFNLRFGYNFRRAAELQLQNVRTFGGLSFGFGLKMNRIKFNFAYSKVHVATNISTFNLIIDLDRR